MVYSELIKIGGKEHEIEVKPITLIVPSANMAMEKIEYPKRIELDVEVTTYHAQRVKKLHPEFDMVWRLFHSKTSNPTIIGPDPVDSDNIRKMGSGAVHLMGLIDLTLKLTDKNVPIAWKFPESFLHPGWQVALADLAIWFSKR